MSEGSQQMRASFLLDPFYIKNLFSYLIQYLPNTLAQGETVKKIGEYQPNGEGGTHSLPAKSKMAARGHQNGRRVLTISFWAF